MAVNKRFRSLVVVPRSHEDGTFQSCSGRAQVKSPMVAQRAVQLDLRGSHESAFIAWDSRLVHQGHTYVPGAAGWNPPLKVPAMFAPENLAWKESLKEEGYVVITDVLESQDVQEALKLLLQDLRFFEPSLQNLDQVRECHLPFNRAGNDLRTSDGLCHGRFAWFLRCKPQVARIFEELFDLPQGSPLIGSVDVVALAPPSCERAVGKQWLHLDYTPPQGRICQACLQLFPRSLEWGARWERIALMVCKAPAAWAARKTSKILLAACISGTASRATAGVTQGKLHREEPGGAKRLPPELAASAEKDGHLRKLNVKVLQERFTEEQLRDLLPAQHAEYVMPLQARKRSLPPVPAPRKRVCVDLTSPCKPLPTAGRITVALRPMV